MKDKRLMLGLLVLLALFILLTWKLWLGSNEVPPVAQSTSGNSSSDYQLARQSGTTVETAKPASVDSPKTPPVKAEGGLASFEPRDEMSIIKYVLVERNDFGEISFTEGKPVVRTLATGETCIMLVYHEFGRFQFETHFVKSTGGHLPSNAEIEALGRKELRDLIDMIDQGSSVRDLGENTILMRPGSEESGISGTAGDGICLLNVQIKPIEDSSASSGKTKLAIKVDLTMPP